MSRLSQVFLEPGLHEAARRGDRAACRAIYDAVSGPVFALACRLVGRTAAEDVFQDAMMRTFERLEDYRAEAPFGMWVRAIAVNACLMHLRSPWRRLRGLVDELGEALEWATAEGPLAAGSAAPQAAIDVERLLAQLPPVARAVLWLHDIEGYSHEDIAAAVGRTTSFSKSQLARARARLRTLAQCEHPPAGREAMAPAAEAVGDPPAAAAEASQPPDAGPLRATSRWADGLGVLR
jgi:RNA polymerase sigma-70 factor (ECF subfamily)